MRRRILVLLAAAGLVGADQLIKMWATAQLQPVGAMPVVPHVIELRYVLNDGMAFSLLSGKQTFLTIITSIALVAVLAYLMLKRPAPLETAAWTLVLGGGIGNLIDRVLNGQVVDYFNFLFINFAVFNFADVCITVGVCLLVLSLILEERKASRQAKADKQKDDDGDTGLSN